MKTYDELVIGLNKINNMGFVKTHRSGNTGIGKTLEDLLEIDENNFAGPDGITTELKSGRKNAGSMLTLFTKSPDPPKINSILLKTFGYYEDLNSKRKILHTTINALGFNTLRGHTGLKIGILPDRVEIISSVKKDIPAPYWHKDKLKQRFETKYKELLYVKADTKGTGLDEEFHFNEAWLMKGFDFESFVKLLKEGTIFVDIRIGQYPDGRTHDHGTGFRIFPDKLDLCFSERKQVI